METINAKKEFDAYTALSSLLLNSPNCKELAYSGNFDASNMKVSLTVNGVEMKIGEFNKIVERWEKRVEKHYKEKYDLLQAEEAVAEKAQELIRQKMDNLYDLMNDLEMGLWKLQEDN